jgi:hypothetical protein
MTRTISIITATVGAALLFVVPAYGDNWGADKAQPTLAQPDPMIEDGFAQAVATKQALSSTVRVSPDLADRAEQIRLERMLDSRERSLVIGSQGPVDARSEGMNRLYGLGEYANPIDLRERGLVEKSQAQTKVEQPTAGFDARSDGLNRIYGLGEYAPSIVADDRFRIDHSNVPEPVSVTSSGRDIEWPQLGIGFGVGLVLLLGLGLTLKATHTRPFAH